MEKKKGKRLCLETSRSSVKLIALLISIISLNQQLHLFIFLLFFFFVCLDYFFFSPILFSFFVLVVCMGNGCLRQLSLEVGIEFLFSGKINAFWETNKSSVEHTLKPALFHGTIFNDRWLHTLKPWYFGPNFQEVVERVAS